MIRLLRTSRSDGVAALFVAVVGVGITIADGDTVGVRFGMILVAAPLLLRWRSLWWSSALFVGVGVWLNGLLTGSTVRCGAVMTAMAYLAFWIARTSTRRQKWCLIWLLPLFLVGEDRFDPVMVLAGGLPYAVLMFLISFGLGLAARDTEHKAKLSRQAADMLRREQARTAELAAAAERLRVYESLQVAINDGFADILHLAPLVDSLPDAMARVQSTAGAALDRLREILTQLRVPDDADPVAPTIAAADVSDARAAPTARVARRLRGERRFSAGSWFVSIAVTLLCTAELISNLTGDPQAAGSLVPLPLHERVSVTAATATVVVAAYCCRRWPFAAAMATSAVGPVLIVVGPQVDYLPDSAALALSTVAYAVGLRLRNRQSWLGFGILLVSLQLAEFGWGQGVPISAYATVGPWLAGRVIRARRRVTAHLQDVLEDLDAERQRQTHLATLFERRHLLGEVHDVLGGALSVVLIQAAAADRVRDADPDAGRRSARTMVETVHQARREVSQLKSGTSTPVVPGDLEELVDRMRRSGMRIAVTGAADLAELPRPVAAAGYRLVQECLTNALRYAEGAPVTVGLRPDGDQFAIVVENGPGTRSVPLAGSGTGLGLAAMRERVTALGGTMTVFSAEHGWTVTARMPMAARLSEPVTA